MTVELGFVALSARDSNSVVRFFRDALRMPFGERTRGAGSTPVFALGQLELAVFEVGDPYLDTPSAVGVDHIAFYVPDAAQFAKDQGLSVVGRRATGDKRQSVSLAPAASPAVHIRLTDASTDASTDACADERRTHATGSDGPAVAETLSARICIRSPEAHTYEHLLVRQLGCQVQSRQIAVESKQVTESFVSDKYGAVVHSRPPEVNGGTTTTYLDTGPGQIALLCEYAAVPGQAARLDGIDAARQPAQSALLAGAGAVPFGCAYLCLLVNNLADELARLEKAGWRLSADRAGKASAARFIDPAHFGGELLIGLSEASS